MNNRRIQFICLMIIVVFVSGSNIFAQLAEGGGDPYPPIAVPCPSGANVAFPSSGAPIVGTVVVCSQPASGDTQVSFPPGTVINVSGGTCPIPSFTIPTGGTVIVGYIPTSPTVTVTINGVAAPVVKSTTKINQKISFPSGGKVVFKNPQKSVSGKLTSVLYILLTGTGVKPIN